MIRIFSRHLSKSLWATGLLLFFSLSILGCDSQDLGEKEEADDPIDQEEPVSDERAVSEACVVCHAGGNLAEAEAVHQIDPGNTDVAIEGNVVIKEPVDRAEGKFTIKLPLTLTRNGEPISDLGDLLINEDIRFRFTLAYLTSETNGDASYWQSYKMGKEIRGPGEPGPAPDSAEQDQAGYISVDTTMITDDTEAEEGKYVLSYKFSTDWPDRTHRIAFQIDGNKSNPYYDFRPDNEPITETRKVAATSSCNECHHDLGVHGGGRKEIAYCVTCHIPDTADAHSGNSLDMKVMIHKIHRGANLPSVENGESYTIWGYRNSAHDYSDVHLPMDIRNCYKCHDGSTSKDGNNWKSVPTKEACGSCHDNIKFELPEPPLDSYQRMHTEGPREDNSLCADCHTANRIVSAHRIPETDAAKAFEFDIQSVKNAAPGQRPQVTFAVIDPTKSEDDPVRFYDIQADAPFMVPEGASRLAVIIGWNTENYDNQGSGNDPAQPVSIDALAEAVRNADGSFTVTSPVAIPADVTGSGTAALEGHPAVDVDGDGEDERIPVKNDFQHFAITDDEPQKRREVADIDGCNDCHVSLSLHGNNRTDAPQVCVICHNGNATDIAQRPDDPALTEDGRVEQAIDFKFLIHAIHSAEANDPLVVYGYGGTEHVYRGHYPGKLENCDACHLPGTQNPSPGIQTTAVGTGDDIASPADDRYATPVAITCGVCHENENAELHMQQNGGGFDLGPPVQPSDDGDDDGGDEIFQPPGHPTSPNCTTAFECHG